MDFTIRKYTKLLDTLIAKGYAFQTFSDFLEKPGTRSIILRHDVDLRPQNSLEFAQIQASKGVRGVYYFRAVPESWDERIITAIHALGHEIGYHYESLTTCKGNMDLALRDFKTNLAKLRALVPVKTICMHGSPLSKNDSKDLWKFYRYRDFGIAGEPYFDVDFKKVLYLTDTGRRWDGHRVSVRDKVNSDLPFSFHSTEQIIEAANAGSLPGQIMFTFHPQRWTDSKVKWLRELFFQKLKNGIKKYFYVKQNHPLTNE